MNFSSLPKTPSKAEIQLKALIMTLRDDASYALSATKQIIEAHSVFARYVADDFYRATETGILTYNPYVESLAREISAHSEKVFVKSFSSTSS